MFRTTSRTAFAACVTIGAALVFLTPSARADRDDGNNRRSEGHSRWSHSRSCHESGDREQARGEHRRGGERHHRWTMKEHGRDGHHHWTMKERGSEGHHRYASHSRRGRDRDDRETARHGGSRSREHAQAAITPAAVTIIARRHAIDGIATTIIAAGAGTQPEVLIEIRVVSGPDLRVEAGDFHQDPHCDHSVGVRSQRCASSCSSKRGVERPAVAGGEVGLDVPELAHAGDDRRDRRLGQDPAQGQLGHRHPGGHERPEGLGAVDARARGSPGTK